MSSEERLLEYWRELPHDAQDQVLKFAKSLKETEPSKVAESLKQETDPSEFVPQTPMGKKLWEIRQKIVESGVPLLSEEELEQELAERRGGWQE